MLFQWVKAQKPSRDYVAYKRDSRIEILISAEQAFDFIEFEKKLAKCQK